MNSNADSESLIESWRNALKRAADYDAWGQPVEAIEVYQRLSRHLHNYSNRNDAVLFTENQKKTLEKIALCIDSRSRALQANMSNNVDSISLDDLRRLEKTLQHLLGQSDQASPSRFPVDLSVASAQLQKLSITRTDSLSDDDVSSTKDTSTLLPKPLPITGKTLLTVAVEHISLKDASQYLDPYISVSVKDSTGKALTATQDTPVAARKDDSVIMFNTDVHIQKTVESLPPGFAVFFEFKHFKPKKATVSTKCWAFIESDEIKEGPLALELYRKPTDYRRKTLKLLTVKPLYLHLRLVLFS